MLTLSASALIEFFCSRPVYDESVWNNGKIINKNNCWMYAINKPKLNLSMKPYPGLGEKGGGDIGTNDANRDKSNYKCSYFSKLIKNDIPKSINMNHIKAAGDLKCPDNYYEIALVLADDKSGSKKGRDYHFYRKDCNGNWSHKAGGSEISKYDASKNLITDPKFSDRKFDNHNYSTFCGYYCIPNNTKQYDLINKKLKNR